MSRRRWHFPWLTPGPEPAATQFAPPVETGAALPMGAAPVPLDLSLSPQQLFSAAALQHAWLAVKRAKGGAGVDGVTLTQFAANLDDELHTLRTDLIAGEYRPRPLRQVVVPKPDDGLRSLAIWALRDRVAQRVVYDLLLPVFDPHFLACSYGFRLGLGVDDAVHAVLAYRNQNLRWVVDADIRNCFDMIERRRLAKLIRRRVRNRLILRYVDGWLDARILTSADGRPRRAGAAQGGVLSPLFANIYLHELDRALRRRNMALVRYADDFVILCRRKAEAQTAQAQAAVALQRIGLEIHPQKTAIRHFDQGFAWLGYFFIRNEYFRM
ncbi:MAG: hypothetical protein KDD78_17305 [Caldilineaceae bacterium]|nr:hypothetical protein [Caldilineaceae bacterium]